MNTAATEASDAVEQALETISRIVSAVHPRSENNDDARANLYNKGAAALAVLRTSLSAPAAAVGVDGLALELRRLRDQAYRLDCYGMNGTAENIREAADKIERMQSPPAGGFVVDAELVRDIDAALAAEDAALGFEQTAIVLRRCRDALTASPNAQPSAKDGVRGEGQHWYNPKGEATFKNFHRSLCERFGYTHDPEYWWRDLVSLEEHIAKATTATGLVDGDKVLWGVVANAGRLSDERKPRWSHVVEATGQGSTSSAELCRRFGFDPDETVGREAAIGREVSGNG